jgi:hypothetical protein
MSDPLTNAIDENRAARREHTEALEENRAAREVNGIARAGAGAGQMPSSVNLSFTVNVSIGPGGISVGVAGLPGSSTTQTGTTQTGVVAPIASLADFAMEAQQRSEWCWAAVAASVGGFLKRTAPGGAPWRQCEIAATVFSADPPATVVLPKPPDVCSAPPDASGDWCNLPGPLSVALAAVDADGPFHATPGHNTPGELATLEGLIIDAIGQRSALGALIQGKSLDAQGKPFTWGHYVAVIGYQKGATPGDTRVLVADPWGDSTGPTPSTQASVKDMALSTLAHGYFEAGDLWAYYYFTKSA